MSSYVANELRRLADSCEDHESGTSSHSIHLRRGKVTFRLEHPRHDGQDYRRLKIEAGNVDATVFLSHEQARQLADAILDGLKDMEGKPVLNAATHVVRDAYAEADESARARR